MNTNWEDIRKKAQTDLSAHEGFLPQAEEAAVNTATLGYGGEPSPESFWNLPLTGKIGRVAGLGAGFAPVGLAGGALFGTGLAAELATGALYGYSEKPEEGESRINNAIINGIAFPAGYAVAKGLGKAIGYAGAKFGLGGASEQAAGAAGEDLSKASEDFGGHNIFGPEVMQKTPQEDLGGTPFGLFKSPEDLAAFKAKQEAAPQEAISKMGEDFMSGPPAPKSGELPPAPGTPAPSHPAFEAPTTQEEVGRFGIPLTPEQKIQNRGREFLAPPKPGQSPQDMMNEANAKAWDVLVNPWAKEFQNLEDMGTISAKKLDGVAEHDLGVGALESIKEAGLHNIGQTPEHSNYKILPKMFMADSLQSEIDEVITRNAIPLEMIQAASQTKEPINFLMSKGINFDDASKLVDNLLERSKIVSTDPEIAIREKSTELVAAEQKQTRRLFKDVFKETKLFSKGCPEGEG